LGDGGGVETILWQRPVTYAVYPASSISVMLEAWARSFGGTATFNLRLGGTSRTPTDGAIIASVTLPFSVDPNYAPVSMAATISKLSGQDYLKLTCIAGSGDARIAEGGVTLT
ncbi:MAG TPA: hypothetical protein VFL67_12450, partial [Mycobacterium sp.]|nr:hypothetical protein [Mycobacterium sp.]